PINPTLRAGRFVLPRLPVCVLMAPLRGPTPRGLVDGGTPHSSRDDIGMTQPPMRQLTEALRQNGLIRFIEHFAELFRAASSHLKDLVVEHIGPDRAVTIMGRTVVNFGSDSFLGLDHDPRVQEAVRRGVERWGTHNGASRAFSSVQSNLDAE